MLGVDLTEIHGLGPYVALKLVAECGCGMSQWPSPKHFTSWLCLCPGNKISGGKVLSSKTRRSSSEAAAALRMSAIALGRTDTALGAFYRRLSSRVGKAKAVTATARKIAVLFYNTLRFGMQYVAPGAKYYEECYRERVLNNCSKLCVKPDRNVDAENHSMVSCSVRTRPIRSASMPASQPPTAEVSSAPVASQPVCAVEMPHSAISAGITKL